MISTKLIDKLQKAQHLVILTGAGVSAESGIPTFRDTLTGLWKNYEAEQLACETGFLADPALVWGWYEWRRHRVLKAKPNPGHIAIAKMAQHLPKLTLITQNVDDLHERAGSQNVLHLHGSLHHPRCFICEEPYVFPQTETDGTTQADFIYHESHIEPPRCQLCGERIRPGVVWFGETLSQDIWNQAAETCQQGDLLLIVGTSGLVWPAANLPYLADKAGIPIAQINPTVTSFSSVASFNLGGKAGEVLSALFQAAFSDDS